MSGWKVLPTPLLAPSSAIQPARHLCLRRPQQQQQQQQQQEVANLKTAYTIGASSGCGHVTKSTTHQPSSKKALALEQTSLNHYPGSKFPTQNLQNAAVSRALYSTEATVASNVIIYDVFENNTSTWQFIVADPSTLNAVIIDPVLDYDRATQVITTQAADALLSVVKDNGYNVDMILETHAHADHLTAASYLQHRLSEEQRHRPSIGIGKRIRQVQKLLARDMVSPWENTRAYSTSSLMMVRHSTLVN
jgi:hypothetical protein